MENMITDLIILEKLKEEQEYQRPFLRIEDCYYNNVNNKKEKKVKKEENKRVIIINF